jgi:hypothetical protein
MKQMVGDVAVAELTEAAVRRLVNHFGRCSAPFAAGTGCCRAPLMARAYQVGEPSPALDARLAP